MKNSLNQWDKIKTEYITTEISFRKLAEKYNISASTLTKRAAKEQWAKKRKTHRNKVVSKTTEKTAQRQANKLVKLQESVDKLTALIDTALDDTKQLYMYVDLMNHKTFTSKKLDTKAIKDLSSSMKDLTSVIRNIYNIPTEQENSAMKLARDKYELDRRKVEAAMGDDEEDTESGVVLIPPVMEEENGEENE